MTSDKQGPAPVDVELALSATDTPHLQPNHEAQRSDGWRDSLERVETLLSRIAGNNDLSSSPEEHLLSDAMGALHDCELRAREALEVVYAMLAALPDAPVLLGGGDSARTDLSGGEVEPPTPPWPPGAAHNAKRTGWKAFFAGKAREPCPFPPARRDLTAGYGLGWDEAAAMRASPSTDQGEG